MRPTILPILLAVLWAPAPARAQTGAPDQPVPRPAPPHMAAPAPTPQAPAPQAPPAEAPPGVEVTVLSLDQCLKEALENSLDIAVRRYDPLKSETGVTVSESAFDPLLTGSASKSKDQQKRISAFIGPYSSQDLNNTYTLGFLDPLISGGSYRVDLSAIDDRTHTENAFNPGGLTSTGFNASWLLTITQPLLRNFGARTNRWLIVTARNTLGQNEARFRQTVIDTLASAEKAYWDLDFALMNLKTQRASQQLARDFLDQNRIKVRVGTLAPIDITQAEAGVADREEGVIEAENAVRTAEDALRQILNVPRDSPLWSRAIQPSDAPPLVETQADIEEAVKVALAKRPDLEQARLDLKSRETELSYRKNQRRWDVTFQGDYGALGFAPDNYSDSYDDLLHRNQRDWKLGVSLSVPIGNRLAVANYTNAEYGVSQSRYTLLGLEQAARVQVRNAVRTAQTNLKRVKAAQVNTRLQREKLDAEQKKFENGMSTSFQVLTFQTDLTSAESRENQAIVDYNKSLVDMERVKGTLLEAKKVALPGTEPGGLPSAVPSASPSAALRGLWNRDAAGLQAPPSASPLGPALQDRVELPSRFVFEGRHLIAAGLPGSEPLIPGVGAGGR